MNWLGKDEGKKCKKLNFKSNSSKKRISQKLKANEKPGGGDWKSKFRKVIKISMFKVDYFDNS